MPFEKKHKLGAVPLNEEPFDRAPVCFNVRKGVKDKLKAVPDWKERLREFVDSLIENVDE
ncbi:hypothetical protein OGM63_01850 [Plectonema radiosum NIES-515]|uniref:Uncharacterized protein n=1 Tax=Plectonema radiosum NIES-515 TaxID=2986073 RepID=A0ABT3AT29_9CYAN|nr:hypothetical protein [Plectonema radiosum]MCV3212282.1 hypothetical protein [Plectonema radiosum NIES-515]